MKRVEGLSDVVDVLRCLVFWVTFANTAKVIAADPHRDHFPVIGEVNLLLGGRGTGGGGDQGKDETGG